MTRTKLLIACGMTVLMPSLAVSPTDAGILLEDYASQPILLTEIRRERNAT